MVAKITEPKDFRRPLEYNDKKVREGVAELIASGNFLKNTEGLAKRDIVQRFERLVALNKNTQWNTLHISLNFHPSEKFGREKLSEIAYTYMDKIGFGGQPYVVYEHQDAGHPHIHIVTTNIREDGSRIDFHNIGRNESETARKEIEKQYKLIRAEDQKTKAKNEIKPLNVEKLQYGKSETKRGITNVLDAVVGKYKYSTLHELNAILSLYNVRAERGERGGRIFENRGLMYRMIDDQGKQVGVPIKASSIYSNPTLSYLEEKFKENERKSPADLKRIKSAIDWIMVSPPRQLKHFINELKKEQIHTVIRQNKEGFVYGLTFVDTKNKSVFNGSDLGEYSAKHIFETMGLDQHKKPVLLQKKPSQRGKLSTPPSGSNQVPSPPSQTPSGGNLLEILTRAEDEYEQTPYELRVDKKKKKNQSPS